MPPWEKYQRQPDEAQAPQSDPPWKHYDAEARRGGDPLREGVSALGGMAREALPSVEEFGKGYAQGFGGQARQFAAAMPGGRWTENVLGRTEPGKAVSRFLDQPAMENWPQTAGYVAGNIFPGAGPLKPTLQALAGGGIKAIGREGLHFGIYELIRQGLGASGFDIPSYVLYRLATNITGRLMRGGGKAAKGAEEAATGAGKAIPPTGPKVGPEKPPPWGEPSKPSSTPAPAKPPASTPKEQPGGPAPAAPPKTPAEKPRVRVKAGSKPADEQADNP